MTRRAGAGYGDVLARAARMFVCACASAVPIAMPIQPGHPKDSWNSKHMPAVHVATTTPRVTSSIPNCRPNNLHSSRRIMRRDDRGDAS
jgi:hypothetical protein